MKSDEETVSGMEQVVKMLEKLVGEEALQKELPPAQDTKELSIVLVGATLVLANLSYGASPEFRAEVAQVCVEKTQQYIDEYIAERDRKRAEAEVKAQVPVALVKGNNLTN